MSDDPLDEPVGYINLPTGTPVVASDGTPVGAVHRVHHHERERIFDGIEVTSDDGRRFVDAPEVGHMTRRQVELEVDAASFAAHPVKRGLLGGLDMEARRVARSLRKRLPGG